MSVRDQGDPCVHSLPDARDCFSGVWSEKHDEELRVCRRDGDPRWNSNTETGEVLWPMEFVVQVLVEEMNCLKKREKQMYCIPTRR